MEKVRYGIIGVGNMGSGHADYLFKGEIEGAELAAICDIDPARLDWAKEKFGDAVALFSDYNDLLASGKVDAIIIATPHYFHPIIGMAAFKAGIHVLSEKPIGVYTKKIEEFMEAAKESGLAFGIMYNQRTNPYHQKLREMVQNGELGELKRCIWIITNWYRTQAYYNSGGWRATWKGEGGGVLMNQCPHNLDLWQWIFGMPTKIRAFCSFGKYHNIEVEDDVTAYAEYANGATGVFITTTGEAPGTNRLEITGSKGKLVYENGKLTFWKLLQDEREFCKNATQGFSAPLMEAMDIKVEGQGREHRDITQNFTNHILHGESLLAPGYDGIRGLSIANAMLLSTWTDSTIELPIDGDAFYAQLQKRIAESNGKQEEANSKVEDVSSTFGGVK